MKKKRLAFFIGSMNRGGAERVISILSREYAAAGWDTDICLLLANEVGYTLDPTTKIHDFTAGGGVRVTRLPYWLHSIRHFVKENKPDVIISFVARINVIVLLACSGLHRKIVISERNDPKFDGRGVPTKLMTQILYPRANAIVFQTKRVMSYFDKGIRKKGIVIPNPIAVTTLADDTDNNKIVSVGRLAEQKNQKMLIGAFADIVRDHPHLELHIYGEGYLRPVLEDQVRALKLEKNIHLWGNVPDVHTQIRDAAFFVLPSDFEGLSNALLEAMMMGLPCISTDCAGSDEYIKNEVSGLLTPVGDQEALKCAMLRFVVDSDLRRKCANGARETAVNFGSGPVLQKWHKIVDEM